MRGLAGRAAEDHLLQPVRILDQVGEDLSGRVAQQQVGVLEGGLFPVGDAVPADRLRHRVAHPFDGVDGQRPRRGDRREAGEDMPALESHGLSIHQARHSRRPLWLAPRRLHEPVQGDEYAARAEDLVECGDRLGGWGTFSPFPLGQMGEVHVGAGGGMPEFQAGHVFSPVPQGGAEEVPGGRGGIERLAPRHACSHTLWPGVASVVGHVRGLGSPGVLRRL
ncbi:hypothetical protein GCM10010116_25830 [Microbispora rosea subsp. aerata]|nr:hypothetical protein GCM10010116_25830 [Microbispora rosea subsp. aerata]GIH54145.1 hypothetical protein Mro02_10590 [Microbispora rosea subsp. aerata]GLJ85119.1 hypothetical protein GCM10017588_38470 [Microbispora rosea subsp. aerata]